MKQWMKKTAAMLLLALMVSVSAGCTDNFQENIVDIQDPPRSDAPGETVTQDPSATLDPNATADPTATVDPKATVDPIATGTPIPISDNVDPSNTIDPNSLDGTDHVEEGKKLTYSEYRSLNSDVIGWIKISDTNVDYPIVKSKDNIDYLTQDATKTASKAGAIFMDYRCSTNGMHVIIYGHNMSKSKIMFAQMTNYSNRSFYDNHRTFSVTFGDSTYTYKVFAVYSVAKSDAQYMAVDADIPSGAAFVDYMNNTLATLSMFPVDTTVGENDHVLTLSTCSHTNYSNGRFVVHAVRVG